MKKHALYVIIALILPAVAAIFCEPPQSTGGTPHTNELLVQVDGASAGESGSVADRPELKHEKDALPMSDALSSGAAPSDMGEQLMSEYGFKLGELVLSPPAVRRPSFFMALRTGGRTPGHTFVVEIADRFKLRTRWLDGRTELPPGHGMLFIFEEDEIMHMWMRGVPISVDLLFIERSGRVVNFYEHAVPDSEDIMKPQYPLPYVLVLPAGTVARLGVHSGWMMSLK